MRRVWLCLGVSRVCGIHCTWSSGVRDLVSVLKCEALCTSRCNTPHPSDILKIASHPPPSLLILPPPPLPPTPTPHTHPAEAAVSAGSAAPRVILLSGTPSLSRPYDLYRQVDLLVPGALGRSKEDFARRCVG
jgi:hypothetical protein